MMVVVLGVLVLRWVLLAVMGERGSVQGRATGRVLRGVLGCLLGGLLGGRNGGHHQRRDGCHRQGEGGERVGCHARM